MFIYDSLPVFADTVDCPVDLIHVAYSTLHASKSSLNLIVCIFSQIPYVVIHLLIFAIPVVEKVLRRLGHNRIEFEIHAVLVLDHPLIELIAVVFQRNVEIGLHL